MQNVTILLFFFLIHTSSSALAGNLTVVSWNIHSSKANLETVRKIMLAKSPPWDKIMPYADIWGLVEAGDESWVSKTAKALTAKRLGSIKYLMGATGGSTGLAILYDEERVTMQETRELRPLYPSGRAPLLVRFTERATSIDFFVLLNDFNTFSHKARRRQAEAMVRWARSQTLPVIALGEYSLQWDLTSGRHDKGYDVLTTENIFQWIRPETLVRTRCSRRNNMVEDFVFLANATTWQAHSEILFKNYQYCNSGNGTPPHRPIVAHIQTPINPLTIEGVRNILSKNIVTIPWDFEPDMSTH